MKGLGLFGQGVKADLLDVPLYLADTENMSQSEETTFKIVSVARRGDTASQLFWADSSFRM